MEKIKDAPWSLVVAIVIALYGVIKTYWWLKMKDKFVTNEKHDAAMASRAKALELSVHERNGKIEAMDTKLCDKIDELKEALDKHFVRREELDGFGRRVETAEKRIDGFVNLTEGARDRADAAHDMAVNVTNEFAGFSKLMDERFKPLAEVRIAVQSLNDKFDRVLLNLKGL